MKLVNLLILFFMFFDFGGLWDDILLKILNINLGNLFGIGEMFFLI